MHVPALSKAGPGEPVEPRVRKLSGRTISNAFDLERPFLECDVSHLVDCIGGLNHGRLIDVDRLTSRYEVMVAVLVIASAKSGVEITAGSWDSSFAHDLGMD